MKKEIMTRKRWLDQLITGIFEVKHVKLLDEEKGNMSPIVYDKGWFQSVKCTDRYLKNYTHLFRRALVDDDTVFLNDNYKCRAGFDRTRAIENAKRYFRSFGYDEVKYSISYSMNDIGRLFFKIITNELFPIIFDIGKEITADVTDKYYKCKDRITSLFSAPDLEDLFYIDAKNEDIDKIVDYELNNQSDADIAIPINTSHMDLDILMRWQKCAVEIVVKPANTEYQAWSERNDLSLDELMEKCVEYPYDEKASFEKPWDSWLDGFVEKYEQKGYFPITHTEIEDFSVLSRYAFFITKKIFFGNCTSYADMKSLIIERLRKTMLDKHYGKISAYYKSIIYEIEEMLDIIRCANIKDMIEHSRDDYKNIVTQFNLDPDILYRSCSFNTNIEHEIIDSVYNVLEKAIYDFAQHVNRKCDVLVKKLKENLSEVTIKRHMNMINDYVNSPSLSENIQLLDERLQENSNAYYSPRKKTYDSKIINALSYVYDSEDNYLKCLKNALLKYYNLLNDDTNTEKLQDSNYKAEYTVNDPNHVKSLKEEIDTKIEKLRNPLMYYLKGYYESIMVITGRRERSELFDFEKYDLLRTELFGFSIILTPFYSYLLEMEKDVKSLIDGNTELNNEKYEYIIESTLSKYKQCLYSTFNIDEGMCEK